MADLLKWDRSCLVGIPEFDEAHKGLFAIGNKVIRAVLANRERDVIRSVIEELVEYAESHFRREEDVLKASGYPDFEAHRAEHKRLLNDVQLFKSRYISGDVEASEVSIFLIGWVTHHIKETDMAYTDHLNIKGIH